MSIHLFICNVVFMIFVVCIDGFSPNVCQSWDTDDLISGQELKYQSRDWRYTDPNSLTLSSNPLVLIIVVTILERLV